MSTPDRNAAESAGWTYDHSAALGMGFAVRRTPDGPEVMTEDKVSYSPAECALLTRAGGITPEVHRVKKVFGGRIIDVGPERTVPSPAK